MVGTKAYSVGEGALLNKTNPRCEYGILGLGRIIQESWSTMLGLKEPWNISSSDSGWNPTWLQSYAFGRGRPLRESCAPVLFKTDVSSYDFRLRFSQLFKLKRASGLVLYVHQLVKSLPGEGRSWFLLCRDFMEVLEQSISPRTKSALLRPRWSLSCTFQSFSALSNFAHWGPINCYVPGTVISFCFRDTVSFTTHDSTVT